jgi:hypothetical protein
LNSFQIKVPVILSRLVTENAPVIQIQAFGVSCRRFENHAFPVGRARHRCFEQVFGPQKSGRSKNVASRILYKK